MIESITGREVRNGAEKLDPRLAAREVDGDENCDMKYLDFSEAFGEVSRRRLFNK